MPEDIKITPAQAAILQNLLRVIASDDDGVEDLCMVCGCTSDEFHILEGLLVKGAAHAH